MGKGAGSPAAPSAEAHDGYLFQWAHICFDFSCDGNNFKTSGAIDFVCRKRPSHGYIDFSTIHRFARLG